MVIWLYMLYILWFFSLNKMKIKTHHTLKTVPKYNRKNGRKIDTSNTSTLTPTYMSGYSHCSDNNIFMKRKFTY